METARLSLAPSATVDGLDVAVETLHLSSCNADLIRTMALWSPSPPPSSSSLLASASSSSPWGLLTELVIDDISITTVPFDLVLGCFPALRSLDVRLRQPPEIPGASDPALSVKQSPLRRLKMQCVLGDFSGVLPFFGAACPQLTDVSLIGMGLSAGACIRAAMDPLFLPRLRCFHLCALSFRGSPEDELRLARPLTTVCYCCCGGNHSV